MYGTHSQNYVERARLRLAEQKREGLFYAALEIRLGVEVRMKEYLAVQHHISKAKKEGWRVAHLGKSLESAFRTGDKVIQLRILDRESKELLWVLYYTPVTKRLQKMAQRLGDYLHAPDASADRSDQWWKGFRQLLETAWLELKKATTGALIGAPLLHTATGKLNMTVEFNSTEDGQRYLKKVGGVGAKALLNVEYLDDLPPETTLH